MIKTRRKHITPGSHAEDVEEVSKILEEARRLGHASIPNTVDGNIDIIFSKNKKTYTVYQSNKDGKVLSTTEVLRSALQDYLIELRERRRQFDKEAKKASKKKA